MMTRRTAHSLLAAFIFGAAGTAYAHEGKLCKAIATADVAVAADANMEVMYPADGEIIRSSDFTILLTLQGDLNGAALDHVHWKIDEGFNHTAADVTGIIDVTGLADGTHTLTTYMATVDHVPINGKKIVTFRVITSGASLLSPAEGEVLQSSDLKLFYQLFGDPGRATFVKVQLDDQPIVAEWDGDGEFLLTGLSDGAHQLRLWRSDFNEQMVGELTEINFSVASTLNPTNASALNRSLKKALKSKQKSSRSSQWKSVRRVLETMDDGGVQHPSIAGLNHTSVLSALSDVKKILKYEAKKKLTKKEKEQLAKSLSRLQKTVRKMQG